MQSIKTILETVRVKHLKGEHEMSFSIQGMSDADVEGILKDLYDLNYTTMTYMAGDTRMMAVVW